MSEQEHDLATVPQLLGLARRLEPLRGYMAGALKAYQQQERLTDDALMQRLNLTPRQLARLSVCKRPDSGSSEFGKQVRQIADYASVEAGLVANLLRQVEAVDGLAHAPSADVRTSAGKTWAGTRPGLLAAARDRVEPTCEGASSSEAEGS